MEKCLISYQAYGTYVFMHLVLLFQSEPSIKLPSLYLIDSIVKNIGNPYVQLFTENIVRNFVLVFQEVRSSSAYTPLLKLNLVLHL